MKTILGIIILFLVCTAHADVYKCTENGKQVFSDQPCSSAAQKIIVKPATGKADVVSEAEAVAASKAFIEKTNISSKKNSIDLDISLAQDRIASLQNERDRALNTLREKKRHANNNLAGAVWEQSISDEMVAVTNSYATRIASAERTLAEFKAKRAALN